MKRSPLKTFTYPQEYDEKECDEFIKHFINFAMYLCVDCLKSSGKYFGLDLCRTAAYEGCFRAYLVSKKVENPDYLHKKGLVRMCAKRCFWSFAVIFGYLPSSGQIYFPKKFISFEDFFTRKSTGKDVVNEMDTHIINEMIKEFPLRESEIHQLFIAGYDYAEIGRKLGYKNKSSPLKMHKRTLKRVKERLCPS